jgi:hypothetical protein
VVLLHGTHAACLLMCSVVSSNPSEQQHRVGQIVATPAWRSSHREYIRQHGVKAAYLLDRRVNGDHSVCASDLRLHVLKLMCEVAACTVSAEVGMATHKIAMGVMGGWLRLE